MARGGDGEGCCLSRAHPEARVCVRAAACGHRCRRSAVSQSSRRQFPDEETAAFLRNGEDAVAGLISADNKDLSWG